MVLYSGTVGRFWLRFLQNSIHMFPGSFACVLVFGICGILGPLVTCSFESGRHNPDDPFLVLWFHLINLRLFGLVLRRLARLDSTSFLRGS